MLAVILENLTRENLLENENYALNELVTKKNQSLQESEQRYRNLYVNMAQGVVYQNTNGEIIDANPAAELLLGMSLDQLRGKTSRDPDWKSIHEDGSVYLGEMHPSMIALSTGMAVRNEVMGVFNAIKSHYRWLLISAVPQFRDQEKTPFQVFTTFTDISDRKQVDDEIRILNSELEKRVQERTSQLEFANQELEAFSYSVSHDLRAPLRAIKGFCQVLLEDPAEQLDEQRLHYLERIYTSANHMSQLIDDLLRLSRVMNAPLQLTQVNLTIIADSILSAMQNNDLWRKVEYVIHPELIAQADQNLIYIALENLLRNAWKFTSKNSAAHIEIGKAEVKGESVYYVKDDGVGFNMTYQHKLFETFQRLHSSEAFEGSGVGLAIVKRIILRHGGRVWAEGVEGSGATFYFTLS